jgi:hypothetical protein
VENVFFPLIAILRRRRDCSLWGVGVSTAQIFGGMEDVKFTDGHD